ncbi:hypothetical protein R3P38DRAFT_3352956 [Favolaschia claudopus]|uniref:Uncharacterized protein n=1 Tax=Favolaschia claudopus TaxID=2862362 RepID=A0AAW0BYG5_9AGAR
MSSQCLAADRRHLFICSRPASVVECHAIRKSLANHRQGDPLRQASQQVLGRSHEETGEVSVRGAWAMVRFVGFGVPETNGHIEMGRFPARLRTSLSRFVSYIAWFSSTDVFLACWRDAVVLAPFRCKRQIEKKALSFSRADCEVPYRASSLVEGAFVQRRGDAGGPACVIVKASTAPVFLILPNYGGASLILLNSADVILDIVSYRCFKIDSCGPSSSITVARVKLFCRRDTWVHSDDCAFRPSSFVIVISRSGGTRYLWTLSAFEDVSGYPTLPAVVVVMCVLGIGGYLVCVRLAQVVRAPAGRMYWLEAEECILGARSGSVALSGKKLCCWGVSPPGS